MKQKITIRVPTNGQKSCTKALKIAVSLPGVESASLKGEGNSQIEITGESVDPVKLTTMLRKKMGQADLVSVGEVKKEEKPKVEPPKVVEVASPFVWHHAAPQSLVWSEPASHYQDPGCSIM